MRYLIILTALALFGCSKDEKATINGTYQVMGSDSKGHSGTGTITISNDVMDIVAPPTLGTFTGIKIAQSGMTFTVVPDGKYRRGSGQVDDNDLMVTVDITHSMGVDRFNFSGSK